MKAAGSQLAPIQCRPVRRILLGLIAGTLLVTTIGLQAQIQATLAASSIPAGTTATLTVRAAAGATVVVTATGPAVVAPARVTVPASGSAVVALGPFAQPGDYSLAVVAGANRTSVVLRVDWPRSSGPVTAIRRGELGASMVAGMQATEQVIDQIDSAFSQMPADAAGVTEARQAATRLRDAMRRLQPAATAFRDAANQLENALTAEPNADPAVVEQIATFSNQTAQAIRDQAEQLLALGRDASGPQADACVRAEVAAMAIQAQQTLTSLIQSGMLGYLADQAKDATPDFARSAAQWATAQFTAGRPLASARTPLSGGTVAPQADPTWDRVKTSITYARTAITGGPWALAAQIGGDIVTGAIARFELAACVVWNGDVTGTTHVEALENGRAFYSLDNGWTAKIRLAGARPTSAGSVSAMRGMIYGRGKDFKVNNQLQTLYGGRPASLIQYLTSQPNALMTGSAVFAMAIEGTAQGNNMALKIRDGKVDYDGRVHGKLAAVVIPLASPVPIVQTYEVPFLGGHWQLMRALGPNGIAVHPIITSTDKRIVDVAYPRELSSQGARAKFTITLKMCAGQCG